MSKLPHHHHQYCHHPHLIIIPPAHGHAMTNIIGNHITVQLSYHNRDIRSWHDHVENVLCSQIHDHCSTYMFLSPSPSLRSSSSDIRTASIITALLIYALIVRPNLPIIIMLTIIVVTIRFRPSFSMMCYRPRYREEHQQCERILIDCVPFSTGGLSWGSAALAEGQEIACFAVSQKFPQQCQP